MKTVSEGGRNEKLHNREKKNIKSEKQTTKEGWAHIYKEEKKGNRFQRTIHTEKKREPRRQDDDTRKSWRAGCINNNELWGPGLFKQNIKKEKSVTKRNDI
ncbi:hypothetical protein BC829DRAFT_389396 [Chytridium lagenaria]|nr:hypothetical protein BC829DRAFT_389396 [Chytridium lagenaria]